MTIWFIIIYIMAGFIYSGFSGKLLSTIVKMGNRPSIVLITAVLFWLPLLLIDIGSWISRRPSIK